jgi:hypothetical protein
VKFKNIIQNLGANLLIIIFGLVGSIILARWLGPSQRGVFAAIILIPTLLQYFVNFGLSSATGYFAAQPLSNKNTIWSNLIILTFFQSIIGFLIGWFVVDIYLQKYFLRSIHLGRLYLFTVPLGLLGMYATYILQGTSHFKVTSLLKCIVPIGYCIGIIWLKFHENLTIENLVYVQLLIQSSYTIIAVFSLYRIVLSPFFFKIEFDLMRQMLSYSMKIWFGDISQLANSRIDQFLIGVFLSSQALGIYTVALSTAGFTGIFANAVLMIMLPSVTGKKNFQEKISETLHFFRKYWLFSLFFHTVFALSLPILIPIAFGKAYSESILLGEILVFGSFFLNAKMVLGGGMLGMGFPEIISFVEILGMIISLILSIFFINTFSLKGVSLAISLSYFIQFITLICLTDKKGIAYQKLLFISRHEFSENINWLKSTSQYFK